MNVPIAEGCVNGQRSSINSVKEGTSLTQSSKTLSTWQGRIRLGRTRLPDPGLLAVYGGDESRGAINDFYGGLWR